MENSSSPSTPNLRVKGRRVLVQENASTTRQVGQILVITREPEKLLSGTVLAVGERPLVEVGDTVWFRRECGVEWNGMTLLQSDMLEAVGDANVVALADKEGR